MTEQSNLKDEIDIETTLRSIFENTTEYCFLKDSDFTYKYVNRQWAQLCGRQPEDITGRSDYDLFPEEIADRIRAIDSQVANTGNHVEKNLTIENTHGRCVQLRLHEGPILNKKGLPAGIVGFGRQISEKDTREILSYHFQEAIARSSEGFSFWDKNGRCLFMNEANVKIFGYENLSQCLGRNFWEVILPGMKESDYFQLRENHLKKEKSFSAIWEGTTVHNEPVVTEVHLTAIFEDEEYIGHVARFADVTERYEMEKRQFKLKDTSIESAVSPIIMTDPYGVISYVNPAFINQWGYEFEQQLKGLGISACFAPSEHQRIHAFVTDAETDKFEVREIAAQRADGTVFTVQGSLAKVRDNQGNLLGLMGSFMDITSIKEHEAALLEAKANAEEANRLKSSFLAIVSHEVRTPLTSIIGYSNILFELLEDRLNEQEQRYFEFLQQGGERLMDTLDMILDISRIEVGEYPVHLVPCSVNLITQEAVNTIIPLANDRGLPIHLNLDPSNPTVLADINCLLKSILNLLHNAIKFTENGSITVQITSRGEDVISIEVIDTGVGFSDDYLPHVFETFSQEDVGYSRPFEGPGLGLALTYRYMKLMEGTISIRSKKDQGSTVALHLHRSTQPSKTSAQKQAPAKTILSSMFARQPVVLFAEDPPDTYLKIHPIMENKYELFSTTSLEETKKFIEHRTVDIIIVDIDLDSKEKDFPLTKYIRTKERCSEIPIIGLVERDNKELQHECIRAGMNDCLTKPAKRGEILLKLAKWLSYRQAQLQPK
ncbi:MAG: PAS domain S-box protein [Chlorobi bacterium]|nr:PAS domain S-box protein [Chlorobiota bacterium]